ncbi:MAG: hypothetical protein WA957_14500 [Alteraurantiacibacter sp.]
MKIAIAVLALLGTTGAIGQDERSQIDQPPSVDMTTPETPVFDPDTNHTCKYDLQLAQGADGEARLYRHPAKPDSLQPMRAVGYEVSGCSFLVMADGSLVRPPQQDQNNAVAFTPAQ